VSSRIGEGTLGVLRTAWVVFDQPPRRVINSLANTYTVSASRRGAKRSLAGGGGDTTEPDHSTRRSDLLHSGITAARPRWSVGGGRRALSCHSLVTTGAERRPRRRGVRWHVSESEIITSPRDQLETTCYGGREGANDSHPASNFKQNCFHVC